MAADEIDELPLQGPSRFAHLREAGRDHNPRFHAGCRTLGDDGAMWVTSYAVTAIGQAEEGLIRKLVKKAAG